MDGIKIEVTGNIARVIERPSRIISGTVGLPVEFTFDSQWDGLNKVAVFQAGHIQKYMVVVDGVTAVPMEVMVKPNVQLNIGVYGEKEDGSVALPTIWVSLGQIHAGAVPEGSVGSDIGIAKKYNDEAMLAAENADASAKKAESEAGVAVTAADRAETAASLAEDSATAADNARFNANGYATNAQGYATNAEASATAAAESLRQVETLLASTTARLTDVILSASAWNTETDNLHSQVVTIDGATEYSKVDLLPSVEQLAIFHDKDVAFVTENEDGVVTVYAIGDKPLLDYTMQAQITEVLV